MHIYIYICIYTWPRLQRPRDVVVGVMRIIIRPWLKIFLFWFSSNLGPLTVYVNRRVHVTRSSERDKVGSARMGVTACLFVFRQGDFWGTPLGLLLSA